MLTFPLFFDCLILCTGHITTGSWKGRGNKYIEFARVLYCKLPTNGKQLPTFPLEPVRGSNPGLRGGESVTTLPPWPLLNSVGYGLIHITYIHIMNECLVSHNLNLFTTDGELCIVLLVDFYSYVHENCCSCFLKYITVVFLLFSFFGIIFLLPKEQYAGLFTQVLSFGMYLLRRRVVGRAEETSTLSSLGFCTVNCQPTASNYQLSHLSLCGDRTPASEVGGESVTTLPPWPLLNSVGYGLIHITYIHIMNECLVSHNLNLFTTDGELCIVLLVDFYSYVNENCCSCFLKYITVVFLLFSFFA